jgi:hypothetical protein
MLQWNLHGHLCTISGEVLDMCMPAERGRSLCDRPRDKARRRCYIRAIVDDSHDQTVVLARKPDARISGVRVPSDVIQSLSLIHKTDPTRRS